MAYQTTQLISRQGYAGLGAVDTVSIPGQPWAYKMVDGSWKCIDSRTGKQVDMDACTAYQKPPGTGRTFLTGALQTLMPGQPAPGTPAATAPSGLPQWVIPVAIGAGALVLVMVLKKK